MLPDAVSSSGSYVLANGKEIEDMLIVNKDRIFLGKSKELIFSKYRAVIIFFKSEGADSNRLSISQSVLFSETSNSR